MSPATEEVVLPRTHLSLGTALPISLHPREGPGSKLCLGPPASCTLCLRCAGLREDQVNPLALHAKQSNPTCVPKQSLGARGCEGPSWRYDAHSAYTPERTLEPHAPQLIVDMCVTMSVGQTTTKAALYVLRRTGNRPSLLRRIPYSIPHHDTVAEYSDITSSVNECGSRSYHHAFWGAGKSMLELSVG